MTPDPQHPLDERRLGQAEIACMELWMEADGPPTYREMSAAIITAYLATAPSSQDAAPPNRDSLDRAAAALCANNHSAMTYLPERPCPRCQNLANLVLVASGPPADAAPGLREALVECARLLRHTTDTVEEALDSFIDYDVAHPDEWMTCSEHPEGSCGERDLPDAFMRLLMGSGDISYARKAIAKAAAALAPPSSPEDADV